MASPAPIQSSDRSVYARRNFGQPDVVSDVYEVYVGPFNMQQGQPKQAVVILGANGREGPDGVHGRLQFSQMSSNSPVRINGTIFNLLDGKHGTHVHTSGDLRNGCTSAGSHYNPYMLQHGDIMDRYRHIGDLGNIHSLNGVSNVEIEDALISLSGVNSILGRAMVVHAVIDDLGRGGNEESKKTGNAGARLACGVIGII